MLKYLTFLHKYSQGLKKAPVYTKMMSIGVIYFSADAICQLFFERKTPKTYSTERTLLHTIIGSFYVAPALHFWHSKVIPALTFGFNTRTKRILAAYLLGEIVLAPIFLASWLFLYESNRCSSLEAGKRCVKAKFWPTLKDYYKYWTWTSFLTYSIIPIHFRPIFTSLYGVRWQIHLSHVANA